MPRITRAELGDLEARRRRRAPSPREQAVQRAGLEYLNSVPGVCAWKAGSGLLLVEGGRRVRMGKAGVADVIGWVRLSVPALRRCPWSKCYHRHLAAWFAVEFKRPRGGKPPSFAQLDFLARLREDGGVFAIVAESVTQVREAVEAL